MGCWGAPGLSQTVITALLSPRAPTLASLPHFPQRLLFICTEKGLFFNKEGLYFPVAGKCEASAVPRSVSKAGTSGGTFHGGYDIPLHPPSHSPVPQSNAPTLGSCPWASVGTNLSCSGGACRPRAAWRGEGTAPPSARQCPCWGARTQGDGLTPVGPARPVVPAHLPFSGRGGCRKRGVGAGVQRRHPSPSAPGTIHLPLRPTAGHPLGQARRGGGQGLALCEAPSAPNGGPARVAGPARGAAAVG